jgi:hypothetical protein
VLFSLIRDKIYSNNHFSSSGHFPVQFRTRDHDVVLAACDQPAGGGCSWKFFTKHRWQSNPRIVCVALSHVSSMYQAVVCILDWRRGFHILSSRVIFMHLEKSIKA